MVVLSIETWMTMFMELTLQQEFPCQPWMHGGESYFCCALYRSNVI